MVFQPKVLFPRQINPTLTEREMNSDVRSFNAALTQNGRESLSFLTDLGQDLNTGEENHSMINTPSYFLQLFLNHIAAIIKKVKHTSILSADFQHELVEDLQDLIQDIEKTQISFLETFNRISRANTSYHEQLALFHGHLIKKFGSHDQQSKHFHDVQRALNETRNYLKDADRKYQVLNYEKRLVENDLQNKIQNLEIQLKNERALRQKSHRVTDTRSVKSLAFSSPIGPPVSGTLNPYNMASLQPQMNHFSTTSEGRNSDPSLENLVISTREDPMKSHTCHPNSKFSNIESMRTSFSRTRLAHKLKDEGESNPENPREKLGIFEFGDDIRTTWSHGKNLDYASENISGAENSDVGLYNPLYSSEDDFAPEFRVLFDKVLSKIERWCKGFVNQPNEYNDSQIFPRNTMLWSYMINCTYPNDRDASEKRVKELISQSSTRQWFTMRMATTYIFKVILSLENFHGFIDASTEKLIDFETRMKKRGMTALTRQNLISQRDTAIKSIIKHVDYSNWRCFKLNQHTKHLRDILGPLLTEGYDRTSAGYDLGSIITTAFDLSTRIHGSGLTFQILFPDIGSKFNASTMIIRDQVDVEAPIFRTGMTHLKLVISPMVTMRNDQGSTIKAKSLQLATVLTMA